MGDADDLTLKIDEAFAVFAEMDNAPTTVGIFKVASVNKAMADAAARPDPVPLYGKLWDEGGVACLFADSNLGKSILAVQMADTIARAGHRVVYFDFEMSDKQFQLRYTSPDGHRHTFPDTFFRAEIVPDNLDEHYEERLLANIEQVAEERRADVLIIDNITWICAEAEKGSEAGKFMKTLMLLKRDKKEKKKGNYSILVVAHTPKRDMSRPITSNDLAGSKRLYNFFDSVFAIGRSARDEKVRYIKQIKVRDHEFTYTADNVIVCTIEKDDDGFMRMVQQGFATEREHLREHTDKDREELAAQVKEMAATGKSYRAIAAELGISKSLVAKLVRK